jgi:hypothetical protein
LEDTGAGAGEPWLVKLSGPLSKSMLALSLFQRRTTYANVAGDLVLECPSLTEHVALESSY